MAATTITLSVRPRGKPIPGLQDDVRVPSTAETASLYSQVAQSSGFSVHRLRITKGSDGSLISNGKDLRVHDTGLRDGSTIYVKDLGPQIAWRTVFLIEYLGPLIIHPILYVGLSSTPTYLQTLSLSLICIHFLKREFETLFIHRFSSATMPMMNIFKNSTHYWILAGANIAFWTYRENAAAAQESNPYITSAGIALFAVGELGNLSNHLTLRGLRSSGGTERGIPRGLGFNLVTCPNYMFETLAWIGITLITWSWSTVIFAVVAVGQMGTWASKKERRYRREFGDKYKRKRSVMLPGIW